MQDKRLHLAFWDEQERENIRVRTRLDRIEDRQARAEDIATAERTRVNAVSRLVEVVVVGVKPYPLTGAAIALTLLLTGASMCYSLATGASLSDTATAIFSIGSGASHAITHPVPVPSP